MAYALQGDGLGDPRMVYEISPNDVQNGDFVGGQFPSTIGFVVGRGVLGRDIPAYIIERADGTRTAVAIEELRFARGER